MAASVAAIAEPIGQSQDITAAGPVALLGGASYPMVLAVLAALNMRPGPPGYGGTPAITSTT